MRVYLLKDEDFDRLRSYLDRDPTHGRDGGSSGRAMTSEERAVFADAHRFYNYQLCKWIDEVQEE